MRKRARCFCSPSDPSYRPTYIRIACSSRLDLTEGSVYPYTLTRGSRDRPRMATSVQPDGEPVTGESFSADRYFATQPPPPSLEHDVARVKEFVQRQLQEGRKVVLVTVRRCLTSRPYLAPIAADPRRLALPLPRNSERGDNSTPRAQCVSTLPSLSSACAVVRLTDWDPS